MESAIPQGKLGEIVREARARTGVPAVAAGLLVHGRVELAADGPVTVDTPFRVASITKWFTASLAALVTDLDAETRRLLSHTADLRPDALEPLPEACRGLWSYSNPGYVLAGEACARAAGTSYTEAMELRVFGPLGLEATSFEEPPGAAEGHIQDGETGHRPSGRVDYPVRRRPAGGIWSTVGDLLRFAEHQLGDPYGLQTPHAEALGAQYCLGCWRRELEGRRIAFDHEGSVAGFQSLLLIVPEQRAALAVLTNSWRGSGLIRHVVRGLGLVPAPLERAAATRPVPGRYALGDSEAIVEERTDAFVVTESETDPLTHTRIVRPPFPLDPLGGGVHGFAGGLLLGHRVDFPRPGVARIGWTALPRAAS